MILQIADDYRTVNFNGGKFDITDKNTFKYILYVEITDLLFVYWKLDIAYADCKQCTLWCTL